MSLRESNGSLFESHRATVMRPDRSNFSPKTRRRPSQPICRTAFTNFRMACPFAQVTFPFEQGALPFEQAALPFEQTPFPFEQTSLPLEQAPFPLEQGAFPFEQAPFPLEQTPFPLEQGAFPFEQTAVAICNGLFPSYLREIPAKRRKYRQSGIPRQTRTLIKSYAHCHLDPRRPGNVLGKSQFTLGVAFPPHRHTGHDTPAPEPAPTPTP